MPGGRRLVAARRSRRPPHRVDDLAPPGHLVGPVTRRLTVSGAFLSDRRCLPMTKPLVNPALAQFVTATSGRNMTRPAYVAVAVGVVMMVLLTVDPAYEAAHHWVDAVLWACLAYFMFEWVVRLRHTYQVHRLWTYALSGRGLLDAVSAAAIPLALILGPDPKSALLLGILWMLKAVPGIPGLRQVRRGGVRRSPPPPPLPAVFF